MVGGEGVLSQFRPNNELGRNFDVLAARILNELRLDIEKGHFDIARDLVASIGGVFAQIVPGKSAEIQAALTALIDSQMQQALVEQPQVNSTAEPVVSAEAQATTTEATVPLKQVSEAEAIPQINACTTIEQVAELIKEWEIPVSLGKLEDGAEVAREPVPGYLAVVRMKTLVDSIIQATDDQLDEVIEKKQKLVPRFGGLREKVIALAKAERTKTIELPLGPAQDEVVEAEPTLVQKTQEFCRYLSINFGKVYKGDLIDHFVRLLTDVSEGLIPVDPTSATVELDLDEDTIGTSFDTIKLNMLDKAVQSFLTEGDFSTAEQLRACLVTFQIDQKIKMVGTEKDSYWNRRMKYGIAKVVISPKQD